MTAEEAYVDQLEAEVDHLRALVKRQEQALKLAGTSVAGAYDHRSEHHRLLHADVDQGKRIAGLIVDNERLRRIATEALTGWAQRCFDCPECGGCEDERIGALREELAK